MRVVELAAFQVAIPLKRAIRHASHTRTETENLIIRCTLENGLRGYGEGVPRDYVTGETLESTWSILQGADWNSWCTAPPQSFAAAVDLADRLPLPSLPDDPRDCKANGGRCAVELAVLDAYGQAYGEPLSAVTRLRHPELFEPRAKVQYSTAITSATGAKLRLAAFAMRLYGFSHLKLKVGIAGQDDVRRLRALRRVVGRTMEIRVDANEAWQAQDAAARIRELEPYGVLAVEQPIPHEQVRQLAAIRAEVDAAIMLDESLCSLVDAKEAVAGGYCDYFNLRLSKCGGFLPTLRLAAFAKENCLGCQLGCQVGETAILSAAGRHFATSVSGLRWLEGSYDRRLVREPLSRTDITFGLGGWAPALAGPGLGIRIDDAALERVTRRREVLYAR